MFRDIPADPSQGRHDEFYNFWNKGFKIITIVIIFIFILGCALISKATLLFVTSQIRQNITLVCNTYTSNKATVGGFNNTQCVVLPDNYNSNPNVTLPELADFLACLALDSIVDATETIVTSSFNTYCNSVTVRWLWCLLLMMVTPYFFVFLRSAWNCCFKTKKNPSLDVFFLVSNNSF